MVQWSYEISSSQWFIFKFWLCLLCNHASLLESELGKKEFQYIFVGYVGERKLWRYRDPIVALAFNGPTCWWATQQIIMPNTKDFEEKLQDKIGEETN